MVKWRRWSRGGLFTPRLPWASNVVVVRKHDKTPTIILDYRALNNVTYKDSSPLPNIVDFWTPVKVHRILESWACVHPFPSTSGQGGPRRERILQVEVNGGSYYHQ